MTELKKDISIDPAHLSYGSLVQHKHSNKFVIVRDVVQNRMGERFITTLFAEDISCTDLKPVPISPVFHEACWIKKNAFEQYIYETMLPQGNVQKIIFTDHRVFLQQPNNPKPDTITIWDNEYKGRGMYVHEFQRLYKLLTGKSLVFDPTHLIKQNQKVQDK